MSLASQGRPKWILYLTGCNYKTTISVPNTSSSETRAAPPEIAYSARAFCPHMSSVMPSLCVALLFSLSLVWSGEYLFNIILTLFFCFLYLIEISTTWLISEFEASKCPPEGLVLISSCLTMIQMDFSIIATYFKYTSCERCTLAFTSCMNNTLLMLYLQLNSVAAVTGEATAVQRTQNCRAQEGWR